MRYQTLSDINTSRFLFRYCKRRGTVLEERNLIEPTARLRWFIVSSMGSDILPSGRMRGTLRFNRVNRNVKDRKKYSRYRDPKFAHLHQNAHFRRRGGVA
ncbi:hypothetical protein TNCT_320541 [Trichonephila clavata]|uniref:Uncharacterized protein n=1 Tax=Trichonephila clavata TaxID=2740835 RepID=A0A8X6EZU3_TRICU|nr:hypothetical protein TNCT_320541 [Trichonephila clavata]